MECAEREARDAAAGEAAARTGVDAARALAEGVASDADAAAAGFTVQSLFDEELGGAHLRQHADAPHVPGVAAGWEAYSQKLHPRCLPGALVLDVRRDEKDGKHKCCTRVALVPVLHITASVLHLRPPGNDDADDDAAAVGTTYQLVGVAVHRGQMRKGHFRAFLRRSDGTWVEYNDEVVAIVPNGFEGVNAAGCGPGAGAPPHMRVGADTASLCLYVRTGEHAPSGELSAEALCWREREALQALGWGVVPPEGGGGAGAGGLVPPVSAAPPQGDAGLRPWVDPNKAVAPSRRQPARRRNGGK